MSEPFIGEIVLFAGNFAPRGWQFCNGQILSIAQNTALFSILGTTYGGNGQTTFALPDFRGRVPVHSGNSTGPGLSPYSLGQLGGVESVTLLSTEMPAHTHALSGTTVAGTVDNPSGQVLAASVDSSLNAIQTYGPKPVNTTLDATSIGPAGGNLPHQNLAPYLAVNFIIATSGIFPSRN